MYIFTYLLLGIHDIHFKIPKEIFVLVLPLSSFIYYEQ